MLARATPLAVVPVITTLWPLASSRIASAWPMPRVPPVMRATCDIGIQSYCDHRRSGRGEIGAAVARQVAVADIAARVVLVDEAGAVARGKALDMAQAAPVDRHSTALSGTDDVTAVVGAGIIVMADRHADGEWSGEAGLALLKQVAELNQVAPILCAGVTRAP